MNIVKSKKARTSKVEQIAHYLTNGISEGRYSPKQRIIESELTDELGTSRGPLREALNLLAARNLLELIPNRGARIINLQSKDFIERIRLLETLGNLAIKHTSDEEIATLVRHHKEDKAVGSSQVLFAKILGFYCQIAQTRNQDLLADYIHKLNLSYFSRHIVMHFDLNAALLLEKFEQVKQAIFSGELERAQKVHQDWCNEIVAAITKKTA